MEFFLSAILLFLVAAFGWLLYRYREQEQMLAQARQTLADLSSDTEPCREPELMLTLRVLDPLALAKRESRSARLLADKLPVMVRKMVYQEVMNELAAELRERDIEVDMQLEYR